MRTVSRIFGPYAPLLLSVILFAPVDLCLGADTVTVQTEFVYQAGENDSKEISRALALFGARRAAIALAAETLTQQGLLKNYQEQTEEIYCLAADNIEVRIARERYTQTDRRFAVAIEAVVDLADFMEADNQNQSLVDEEDAFPWREEMEQSVSRAVDPGRELSRAHRYLRRDETRIAIIYLDHLSKKYPNWSDVYYLRALGFERMHYEDQRGEDLKKACALGHEAACRERQAMK